MIVERSIFYRKSSALFVSLVTWGFLFIQRSVLTRHHLYIQLLLFLSSSVYPVITFSVIIYTVPTAILALPSGYVSRDHPKRF